MAQDLGLTGKVAIVTGGGSGMGRATALAFAKHDARVVVADLDGDDAEATAASIREDGGEAIAIRTNVSSSSEVQALVAATMQRFGRLDCAANAAGIAAHEGGVINCPEELWERILAVNLTGTFLCVKYQAKVMIESGGSIVNFSSIGGIMGSPDQIAYVASKHGILGVTKSAAIGLAARGIRVNAICPGYTLTPMTERLFGEQGKVISQSNPMQRPAEASEMANAALWLCSPASSYVTGTSIVVDGGWIAGLPVVASG